MNELNTEVVRKPDLEASVRLDACLDLLAEALAERFIDDARLEIADELGVPEAEIDHPGPGSVHQGGMDRWEVGA
jgi:hypothetical protein